MLCVDMDNCAAPAELRAKLATDKHVLAAFISPTGSGVKVLVRVKADASLHAASFAAARKHFGETFGVSVDEACKDVSRLCFASYDPDAFIREEDAEILEPLPQAEQQQPPPKPEPEAETYESLPRPCYRVYHDLETGDIWYPAGTWFPSTRTGHQQGQRPSTRPAHLRAAGSPGQNQHARTGTRPPGRVRHQRRQHQAPHRPHALVRRPWRGSPWRVVEPWPGDRPPPPKQRHLIHSGSDAQRFAIPRRFALAGRTTTCSSCPMRSSRLRDTRKRRGMAAATRSRPTNAPAR